MRLRIPALRVPSNVSGQLRMTIRHQQYVDFPKARLLLLVSSRRGDSELKDNLDSLNQIFCNSVGVEDSNRNKKRLQC
jgi:hypothetical protein